MSAPPPPPGMIPPGPVLKSKPLNLSSKPLKSFNWTKLPPLKIKDTVWSSIDDEEIHTALKGNTYNEFEDLFASREVKETPISPLDSLGILNFSIFNLLTFQHPKKSHF